MTFEYIYVENEPRRACCGKPPGQCACGGVDNVSQPEPLPATDWEQIFNEDAAKLNLQSPPSEVGYTTNSAYTPDGIPKPIPLGQPNWDWDEIARSNR